MNEEILNFRDGLGITQQQLADHLGISRSLLASYEGNRRKIPQEKSFRLTKMEEVYFTSITSVPRHILQRTIAADIVLEFKTIQQRNEDVNFEISKTEAAIKKHNLLYRRCLNHAYINEASLQNINEADRKWLTLLKSIAIKRLDVYASHLKYLQHTADDLKALQLRLQQKLAAFTLHIK